MLEETRLDSSPDSYKRKIIDRKCRLIIAEGNWEIAKGLVETKGFLCPCRNRSCCQSVSYHQQLKNERERDV